MILIADSGSTKTDWCLADENQATTFKTNGINPFFQTDEEIRKVLSREVLEQLPITEITEVYFYGAGCATPVQCRQISGLLQHIIGCNRVEVNSDLLGAARALCGDEPGIACILGTGSNSCYYDGKKITQHISPLGFILGDEGSGADLGRRLVADCLKEELSQPLRERFFARFKLSQEQIMQAVYKGAFPNRFLASLSPFIAENLDEPEIRALAINAFMAFFCRNVLHYPQGEKVNMVGSIAYYYRPVLQDVAQSLSLPIGKILPAPITELAKYHRNAN